jgi:hypothetical protein
MRVFDDYYHLGNDTKDVKALCTLLNELHEKNKLNELYEENKQLKHIIKENSKALIELSEDNNQFQILVKSLKDENQKLKLRLKDLGVEYYD